MSAATPAAPVQLWAPKRPSRLPLCRCSFFCPSTEFTQAACSQVAALKTDPQTNFNNDPYEYATGLAVAVSPDSGASSIAVTSSRWGCDFGGGRAAAAPARVLRGDSAVTAGSTRKLDSNFYGCRMYPSVSDC